MARRESSEASRPARKAALADHAAEATSHRASLRRTARHVTRVLADQYGSPRHANKDDPLDELIFILLSQMTTQPSFARVFDRLKRACPEWDRVLEMPLSRVRALIKDAGLSKGKSIRIQEIARRLQADFGTVSLDRLRGMADAEAESYLTSLPGVGVKTAKCVLMYSLGREVLPVDTHVWRVARRIGLLQPETPYSGAHAALEDVVAPDDRYSLHVNAVAHGRHLCKAKRPLCADCPLARLCPSGRSSEATSP